MNGVNANVAYFKIKQTPINIINIPLAYYGEPLFCGNPVKHSKYCYGKK